MAKAAEAAKNRPLHDKPCEAIAAVDSEEMLYSVDHLTDLEVAIKQSLGPV